jgi:hypothetical protein
MARKATTLPGAASDTDAAKKGEENLNTDDLDEDEDNLEENESDSTDEDENTDDTDDSDEDDNSGDDDLSQEAQDKEFLALYGYPPRTAAKDMTQEQELAYFKKTKKDWEKKANDAIKAFDGLTPDELRRLRAVETAHTELLAKGNNDADTDKAVAEATASIRAKFVPILVSAKLQALTSADEAKIKKILSRVNIDDFVSEDGDLNDDAIAEFAEDFFPAVQTVRKPSGSVHNGPRNNEGKAPMSDLEKGRQRALERRNKN